jgi:outer membrane protein OmpU
VRTPRRGAGETVLDNGLTVGARIELEGQTSTDQIDAVFAYVSGGFGELRFGDTGEALAQLCYLVPSASAIFGADSPNFNFSNSGVTGPLGPVGYGATNGTCYGVDDKSTKIVYFSPNFAGFSFAASFTPDDSEDTRNTFNGAGTRFSNDAGESSENLSVAANFTRDFDGISVVGGGGATWSFDRENDDLDPGPGLVPSGVDEREEYNAYARVGYAGFTLGGAYSYRKNTLINGADSQVYGAGITYNFDAWTVGLGWSHGDYEFFQPTPTPSDITDDYDIFSVTGSYALGPGIQLDGVIEYYDYRHDEEEFEDYHAIGVGIGTLISF